MLKNKGHINPSPVLLSFQPSSSETPTLFHSLDQVLFIDLRGKREDWGQNPQRSSPPAWGLSPLPKRKEHSFGGTDIQIWMMAGLAGEGSRCLYTIAALSPPSGDASGSALVAPQVVLG